MQMQQEGDGEDDPAGVAVLCEEDGQLRARLTVFAGRRLGGGAGGRVYAGELDGAPVAVKLMHPSAARREEQVQAFVREARAQARLSHGNIIKVLAICHLPPAFCGLPTRRHTWGVVLELAQLGPLTAAIRAAIQLLPQQAPAASNQHSAASPTKSAAPSVTFADESPSAAAITGAALPYSDAVAVGWCLDVAQALAFLHAQKPPIIHRDVKPDNILLVLRPQQQEQQQQHAAGPDEQEQQRYAQAVAKVADFGVHAVLLDPHSARSIYTGRQRSASVVASSEHTHSFALTATAGRYLESHVSGHSTSVTSRRGARGGLHDVHTPGTPSAAQQFLHAGAAGSSVAQLDSVSVVAASAHSSTTAGGGGAGAGGPGGYYHGGGGAPPESPARSLARRLSSFMSIVPGGHGGAGGLATRSMQISGFGAASVGGGGGTASAAAYGSEADGHSGTLPVALQAHRQSYQRQLSPGGPLASDATGPQGLSTTLASGDWTSMLLTSTMGPDWVPQRPSPLQPQPAGGGAPHPQHPAHSVAKDLTMDALVGDHGPLPPLVIATPRLGAAQAPLADHAASAPLYAGQGAPGSPGAAAHQLSQQQSALLSPLRKKSTLGMQQRLVPARSTSLVQLPHHARDGARMRPMGPMAGGASPMSSRRSSLAGSAAVAAGMAAAMGEGTAVAAAGVLVGAHSGGAGERPTAPAFVGRSSSGISASYQAARASTSASGAAAQPRSDASVLAAALQSHISMRLGGSSSGWATQGSAAGSSTHATSGAAAALAAASGRKPYSPRASFSSAAAPAGHVSSSGAAGQAALGVPPTQRSPSSRVGGTSMTRMSNAGRDSLMGAATGRPTPAGAGHQRDSGHSSRPSPPSALGSHAPSFVAAHDGAGPVLTSSVLAAAAAAAGGAAPGPAGEAGAAFLHHYLEVAAAGLAPGGGAASDRDAHIVRTGSILSRTGTPTQAELLSRLSEHAADSGSTLPDVAEPGGALLPPHHPHQHPDAPGGSRLRSFAPMMRHAQPWLMLQSSVSHGSSTAGTEPGLLQAAGPSGASAGEVVGSGPTFAWAYNPAAAEGGLEALAASGSPVAAADAPRGPGAAGAPGQHPSPQQQLLQNKALKRLRSNPSSFSIPGSPLAPAMARPHSPTVSGGREGSSARRLPRMSHDPSWGAGSLQARGSRELLVSRVSHQSSLGPHTQLTNHSSAGAATATRTSPGTLASAADSHTQSGGAWDHLALGAASPPTSSGQLAEGAKGAAAPLPAPQAMLHHRHSSPHHHPAAPSDAHPYARRHALGGRTQHAQHASGAHKAALHGRLDGAEHHGAGGHGGPDGVPLIPWPQTAPLGAAESTQQQHLPTAASHNSSTTHASAVTGEEEGLQGHLPGGSRLAAAVTGSQRSSAALQGAYGQAQGLAPLLERQQVEPRALGGGLGDAGPPSLTQAHALLPAVAPPFDALASSSSALHPAHGGPHLSGVHACVSGSAAGHNRDSGRASDMASEGWLPHATAAAGPDQLFACLTGRAGTTLYMAPEVAREDLYNEKSDVYSFAVVMYEVLGRVLLLAPNRTRGEVEYLSSRIQAGYRPRRPALIVREDLWQLIISCWAHDPAARPSMRQVVHQLAIIRKRVEEGGEQEGPEQEEAQERGSVTAVGGQAATRSARLLAAFGHASSSNLKSRGNISNKSRASTDGQRSSNTAAAAAGTAAALQASAGRAQSAGAHGSALDLSTLDGILDAPGASSAPRQTPRCCGACVIS